MKTLQLLSCVLIGVLTSPTIQAGAQSLETGSPAPTFEVRDGEGRTMSMDMARDRIILLFYETKNVVEKNRALKTELGLYLRSRDDEARRRILILAVVDCSSAWPFTGIWKSKLRENSAKERITIYGDWNGKMRDDYKMKKDDTNFIIIDNSGRISLLLYGEIDKEQTDRIKKMLDSLTGEQPGGE